MDTKPYYELLMQTNSSLTRITVLEIKDHMIDESNNCIYTFDYINDYTNNYLFDRVLEKGKVFKLVDNKHFQRTIVIEKGSPANALQKLYNNSTCETRNILQCASKGICEALNKLYRDDEAIEACIDINHEAHLVHLRYYRANETVIVANTKLYQYQ